MVKCNIIGKIKSNIFRSVINRLCMMLANMINYEN